MRLAPLRSVLRRSFPLVAVASLATWIDLVPALAQGPERMPSIEVGATVEDAPAALPSVDWSRAGATSWIWGDDSDRRYVLTRSFEARGNRAVLRATSDNGMQVRLNGRPVATSETWEEPVVVDVSEQLRSGANELSVTVSNAGGIAAFVAQLALIDDDGTEFVVTDGSWSARPAGNDAAPAAAVRVVDRLGSGPWGNVFANGGPANRLRDLFVVRPGFAVERLYQVPRDEQGSWVAMTFDPRGRLIVSDQEGKGLYRVTPPALDSDEPTRVEKIDLPITSAQGLLYAFDALYVSVNGGPGSGLYRVTDENDDDRFDRVEKLAEFRGGGEHGPHALRLSPDGERIVVICGNHTLPVPLDASRISTDWDEDLLLPRNWDANGHAAGILAPGGWIAETDPQGKRWTMHSIGYRNPYDMDFNADGELFAYDADMEWDLGTPWYRPTRVVHATSGSEFGWRSGTGKWPVWYEDSLPPAVDIGPGSPVGVAFGYGTRFPAEYQRALFICDWTFGTMYAIHLTPNGSSYDAVKEEFVSRTPLPLTDVAVGPDGALYFTVGGRGTQSELYRIRYVGDESTAAVDPRDEAGSAERAARRRLEALHRDGGPALALDEIWSSLGSEDRFLRYAARIALEFQPVDRWRERLTNESDPSTVVSAVVALARVGKPIDLGIAQASLLKLDLDAMSVDQRLAWERALQLVFIRLGAPEEDDRLIWLDRLDRRFPAEDDRENRELIQLLTYLGSETVVAKGLELLQREKRTEGPDLEELIARNRGYGGAIAAMLAAHPDLEQLHAAFVLRNARVGWTAERRVAYFRWFEKARAWSGGASYQGFLTKIDQDAYQNATDAERLAVEALGARTPYRAAERPAPHGPGRDWTVEQVLAEAGEELRGRDYEQGRRAFAAANCVSCHRFLGDGGATGPDLTQSAGRFGLKDMVEAIVEPSKVVSDQYRAMVIETADGVTVSGRIVSETDTTLVVLLDPQDSSKVMEIAKEDVVASEPSPVSLMPADLLDSLNRDEVLDLLAFVLSRGDAGAPMFRK